MPNLFGREAELTRLRSQWQKGEFSVALVAGELGIGKTALIEAAFAAITKQANPQKVVCLRGRASDDAGMHAAVSAIPRSIR